MTDVLTVAGYLGRRLRSLGVEHLFGVPGDFTLALLDSMLSESDLTWIGSPSELNAGYAADAYARIRGAAAVVTTFGVGELSVLNAVAGSYAENVPVIQVTGAPPTSVAMSGALTHHTLGDGDFGRFARAYAEVTAAGAVLAASTAAEQIDAVLAVAVHESRPVYLCIPADVATAPVSAERLAAPLPLPAVTADAVEEFRSRAAALLAGVESTVLIAGQLVERTRSHAALTRLAEKTQSPVVTLAASRGAFDPTHPLSAGVYCGGLSAKRAILAVDTAEVVIEVGTVMSDTSTGNFTHRDDPARTIHLAATVATVAGAVVHGVPLAVALDVLTTLVEPVAPRDGLPPEPSLLASDIRAIVSATDLDQAAFWTRLESWFPADARLLTDIGTPYFGAMGIRLPAGVDLIAQPTWSSIGYSLPATLGCALADPARRPVLVIGDGAAQMTAQDLGTLARYGAAPVVIVLDNSGYTIERGLRSPDAPYHDVASWDWCALAHAMAPGSGIRTVRVETPDQLAEALAEAGADPCRMLVLHVLLPAMDMPPALRAMADAYQGA